MKLFKINTPKLEPIPIVVSIPHAGTKFPKNIKGRYNKRMLRYLDDTDWFVHKLYDFAPEMGITVIKANLSRWVVDLNRDPEQIPLYTDGRLITGIAPTTDFFGNKLYVSKEDKPDADEIAQRVSDYYWPYYRQVQEVLNERKQQFGHAILWDAHSIRHRVSTIQRAVFPDIILGNNNEKTAHAQLIKSALESLQAGSFGLHHNQPFKGGHITRYFGKPEQNVHALQLEMNKILYMDDNELFYNKTRAKKVKKLLKNTLTNLNTTLASIR